MDYNLTVNSFIAYMRLDSGWPDSSRLFSPGHPRSIIQTLGSSTAVSGIAAFYEFRFHAGRQFKGEWGKGGQESTHMYNF